MFTRLRIFSAIALIWVSSSAMAVTGTTTFVPGDNSSVGGADVGYSVDSCDGPSMGSMAMPILSDGKKICALYETDLNPFGENTIVLVIEGFTSDPGVNYFKTLSLPCGLSLAPSPNYFYFPATAGSSGEASWNWDISVLSCFYDARGLTLPVSIN